MRKVVTAAAVAAFATLWGLESAIAEPPPWAPAHGYRAKHAGKAKARGGPRRVHGSAPAEEIIIPIDLSLGACNRQDVGAILGGAVGGVLGSQVGSGSGRTAATIGGTIVGVIVGGEIGRTMDEVDQNCVGHAMERAEDGQSIKWNGTDDQLYEVTPTRTYQADAGQFCREYTTTAVIGGRIETVYGSACRKPDGSWELNPT